MTDDFLPDPPRLGADALPEEAPARATRGEGSDPYFGLLVGLAVSLGLTPILPANADLRFTLAWGALAGISVIAWLLGNFDRIAQEKPEDLLWGIGFALILSVPFSLFFFDTFGRAAHLAFPKMTLGTLLAYLVFVMPLSETLFFRGLLQRQQSFWSVGVLSGVWSVVLFFPVMWGDILKAPAVALFLIIALITINMMYSYVRERNSLAAAWLCQVVANVVLFFLPYWAITPV
jgi:membrane protease YdiL (CAAX protease family)